MANLVELFDNIVQMQNLNGVPLANGKMYVYALGRTRLMDTWSDVDGESLNSNPIILDAAGQCRCYVTDDFDYTVVVTDEYNNEIFSIDKYLYSKGSHSHADVAVAPSETIAVSSYHVGECTIYVPYLTGQLGKVYEGIDPIVVNNTEDKISAQHVPLGVQDPLYFVQDDEEGCIIGFSGETVPEGVMVESALGFENDKITGYNGSAFSAGNEYEEGSYISIDNNVISVTGLSPVPSDTASTGLVAQVSADIVSQIPSTAGLATTAQLDEKLDKADSANFYPMNSNPSGYISELPSDLATTGWVDSQGYLTAVDIPESANWNSTYNTVSANSAQWAGGTANPQIPVTGINGIKISESGDKVVFEVSGDYYTNDNPSGFITGVPADMATTGDIADLAQSISETYQPIGNYQTAGDYYSASNPSGFITGVDLSDYATTAELADKQDITGMTAYQPVGNYQTAGDYLTTADSANFYTTANESGFITGVDLTPYQLTADMTAYQPAGDYLTTADSAEFYTTANESGFITNDAITGKQDITGMTAYQPAGDYLTTGDSANFYTTANESGFITGVDLTPYQTTAGMTAYANSADVTGTAQYGLTTAGWSEITGGGEVPEGVLVESGLDYDNTEISGYSGSAFKDVALTDVVTVNSGAWGGSALPVSAGPGVKISLQNDTLVFSTDETVLFSASPTTFTTAFTTTEPISNFEKIVVHQSIFTHNEYLVENHYYDTYGILTTNKFNVGFSYNIDNGWKCWGATKWHVTNGQSFVIHNAGRLFAGPGTTSMGYNDLIEFSNGTIYKVVGINRIAGE